MTNEKHTPGPWSVPHFARPDVNCECGYILTDGMMGAVATVHCSGEGNDWKKHGDNPQFEQAVANAHLIAAAPDLLAALAGAIGALEFSRDYHKDLGNEEQAFAQDRLDAALKAIAKAST